MNQIRERLGTVIITDTAIARERWTKRKTNKRAMDRQRETRKERETVRETETDKEGDGQKERGLCIYSA